jgi:hypothetical protein
VYCPVVSALAAIESKSKKSNFKKIKQKQTK